MLMADALVSPAVAAGAGFVAATLIGVAATKVTNIRRVNISFLDYNGGIVDCIGKYVW